MTVSNITPLADYLVLPGDSFSFTLDDGGVTPSSIQVTVKQTADDIAWTLAGGFQPGFSGTAVKVGNVYTITVAASAGWNKSPHSRDREPLPRPHAASEPRLPGDAEGHQHWRCSSHGRGLDKLFRPLRR